MNKILSIIFFAGAAVMSVQAAAASREKEPVEPFDRGIGRSTSVFIPAGTIGAGASFSYSNYCINSQHLPGNVRNRLQRKIPNLKRMRSYPAFLIGRLGVDVRYHGLGLGSQTLDFIMRLYLHPDREGLRRFVIVEALNRPETIRFYGRNGFNLLYSSEGEELSSLNTRTGGALKTRMMYCDLKLWRDRQNIQ